jgi:hypothetical protein
MAEHYARWPAPEDADDGYREPYAVPGIQERTEAPRIHGIQERMEEPLRTDAWNGKPESKHWTRTAAKILAALVILAAAVLYGHEDPGGLIERAHMWAAGHGLAPAEGMAATIGPNKWCWGAVFPALGFGRTPTLTDRQRTVAGVVVLLALFAAGRAAVAIVLINGAGLPLAALGAMRWCWG